MHHYNERGICWYCGDNAAKVRTDYVSNRILIDCLRSQQTYLLDHGVEDFADLGGVA